MASTKKRKGLCHACVDEEIRRAFDCYDREKAAIEKGEPYKCTCPPLPCDENPDHG